MKTNRYNKLYVHKIKIVLIPNIIAVTLLF